jgi:hypothetical protein
MATGLFDSARNSFARGEILWKATAGSVVRAFLIDADADAPNLATDDFLNDILTTARKGGTGGGTGRADGIQLTLLDPVAGVCDASDIVFPTVTGGVQCEGILLYVDDGAAEASSRLIAYIDNATGLPVTTNGADINVAWDNGANKIFKL